MIQNTGNLGTHVPFTDLLDLASAAVGGQALACSDDFFAPMAGLLKPEPAVFIPGKYTEQGKWMDGWESRRKRGVGPGNDHDWCVVRLGIPGVIRGLNVDTAFFLGNFPEYASVEACSAPAQAAPQSLGGWVEILPKAALRGGSANLFAVASDKRFTHLRLRIFPDGGVARLRVHGEARPDWAQLGRAGLVDLAGAENGGSVVVASDMFFGQKDNLILPGRAATMGEGWETRRRRGPGHDWIIVRLGKSGKLRKIEVDTNHFKGNFPESCSVDACALGGARLLPADFRDRTDIAWKPILPRVELQAHHQHVFEKELLADAHAQEYDHVRLSIYPDGGVSRLRVLGEPGA
jgi:allantoicase